MDLLPGVVDETLSKLKVIHNRSLPSVIIVKFRKRIGIITWKRLTKIIARQQLL